MRLRFSFDLCHQMQMLSANTIICCQSQRTHSWCLTLTQTSACKQGITVPDLQVILRWWARPSIAPTPARVTGACCSITWFHSSGEWWWWRGDAGLKVTRKPLIKTLEIRICFSVRFSIWMVAKGFLWPSKLALIGAKDLLWPSISRVWMITRGLLPPFNHIL